eukprot:9102350-Prorocentrum_lima.AAC.1
MQSAPGTSAVVESSSRPPTRTSPASRTTSATSSTQHAEQSTGAPPMWIQNPLDTPSGTITSH